MSSSRVNVNGPSLIPGSLLGSVGVLFSFLVVPGM